jgi:hypothetical protein
MISLRLKGKWSIRQRQRFHSNLTGIIYPLPVFRKFSMVLPLTRIYFTIWEVMLGPKGGENARGLSSSPFLAINAKGGESIKPKAKERHHHFKKF